ncbi:MAG TPA: carbohydrate binding domain-containing protein [Polyangiaceae bacterium]|nr:carbohydrate binding domain-containing protein [Polyangiaceae bacterium]
MRRPFPTWLRSSALVLALPGCLVSFNDYPLGDLKADEPRTLLGGAAGTGSVLPNAGSSATAGSSTGGTIIAGADGGGDGGAADVTPPDPNALLVDDFEDTNAQILERQGRSGSWYVANDGRGLQTPRAGVPVVPAPLMPPRGTSTRGAHTFGGPFSTWGALIGTVLAAEGVAYDLSGYQGLRVWVRSGAAAPGAAKSVRLNLRTPATVMGGGCTTCGDHFGADIPLTAQWAQVDVPFASLAQLGFGRPVLTKPDLEQALGIEFLFPINVSFDLWLDDIELY